MTIEAQSRHGVALAFEHAEVAVRELGAVTIHEGERVQRVPEPNQSNTVGLRERGIRLEEVPPDEPCFCLFRGTEAVPLRWEFVIPRVDELLNEMQPSRRRRPVTGLKFLPETPLLCLVHAMTGILF
jgi:hypothetical protein